MHIGFAPGTRKKDFFGIRHLFGMIRYAAALVLILATSGYSQPLYVAHDLGPLTALNPVALSDQLEVLGTYGAGSLTDPRRGRIKIGGVVTDLAFVSPFDDRVRASDGHGIVVGHSLSPELFQRATVWIDIRAFDLNSALASLFAPAGTIENASIEAIETNGSMTGWAEDSPTGKRLGYILKGFNSGDLQLTAIGTVNNPSDSFIGWEPTAINASDEVVGTAKNLSGGLAGFHFDRGILTYFGPPPSRSYPALPTDINDAGLIVGTVGRTDSSGTPFQSAYLWGPAGSLESAIDLGALCPSGEEQALTNPHINGDGTVLFDCRGRANVYFEGNVFPIRTALDETTGFSDPWVIRDVIDIANNTSLLASGYKILRGEQGEVIGTGENHTLILSALPSSIPTPTLSPTLSPIPSPIPSPAPTSVPTVESTTPAQASPSVSPTLSNTPSAPPSGTPLPPTPIPPIPTIAPTPSNTPEDPTKLKLQALITQVSALLDEARLRIGPHLSIVRVQAIERARRRLPNKIRQLEMVAQLTPTAASDYPRLTKKRLESLLKIVSLGRWNRAYKMFRLITFPTRNVRN